MNGLREFVFVLEQTLGHAAHGRNLERALGRAPLLNATVIRLDNRPPRPSLPLLGSWSARASLRARTELERRLRQRAVDACFIHTQVASLLATGFMRRVPTVVSLDATPLNFDSQAQAYGHRTHPTAVEHFKTAFTGRAFNAAAALVTWCRWAAESLGRDYGVPAEKVTVIHPGVDLDLFAVPDRSARRGPVRLLFVGGDFERKGGVELLQAVSSLETDAELDVVCSKSSAPRRLPGGIPCRMHFGLAPQSEELLRLYREADVFVLPARGDCFPQAVAEALASGLPVVSTLVGAIPEMIRDGHNGLLVPARAPAPLSDALSALISDRALRLEMGERARRLAEREHDAGRNAQQILALMTSLSNQARLPRSA